MEQEYHIPVLLKESIEGLNINPNGVYVDLTFGGGGHSKAILQQLDKGRLVVFDQDDDAYLNRPDDERLIFVRHNFRYMQRFLKYAGIEQVDGVLGDLGVSSHHFDVPERGFSFRFDAPLDMRMSQGLKKDAAEVLNTYTQDELKTLFSTYGEIKQAGKLASIIISARQNKPFRTTTDLRLLAENIGPKKEMNKFLAQAFQALRIEVNQEIEVLKSVLMQSSQVLKVGGRLVVISYHSLEDRLVKNFIKTGDCNLSQVDTDIYGRSNVPFNAIHRKVIVPTDEELVINTRSRSAKMRIAERIC